MGTETQMGAEAQTGKDHASPAGSVEAKLGWGSEPGRETEPRRQATLGPGPQNPGRERSADREAETKRGTDRKTDRRTEGGRREEHGAGRTFSGKRRRDGQHSSRTPELLASAV